MTKTTFTKPPIINTRDKEKKADNFINQVDKTLTQNNIQQDKPIKKEIKKAFLLRMPSSSVNELNEISALTGISRNSICLELLRPTIKQKLKELKEK
jgi:hypothetical protein